MLPAWLLSAMEQPTVEAKGLLKMAKEAKHKDTQPQLGNIIGQERRARKLSLRQLAEKVKKGDGSSIAPQYLHDIELNYRLPSPHILRELARELGQDPYKFLMLAGAAAEVVREYLEEYPQEQENIIRLFGAAKERGFKDWQQLQKIVERSRKDSK